MKKEKREPNRKLHQFKLNEGTRLLLIWFIWKCSIINVDASRAPRSDAMSSRFSFSFSFFKYILLEKRCAHFAVISYGADD